MYLTSSSVLATSSDALVTSSFLLPVAMPGAPSSVLGTNIACILILPLRMPNLHSGSCCFSSNIMFFSAGGAHHWSLLVCVGFFGHRE